jgi:hypothetical protein
MRMDIKLMIWLPNLAVDAARQQLVAEYPRAREDENNFQLREVVRLQLENQSGESSGSTKPKANEIPHVQVAFFPPSQPRVLDTKRLSIKCLRLSTKLTISGLRPATLKT